MSKQLNQMINNSNVAFVMLNQARDDFDAYRFPGAPVPIKSTGGRAMEHWPSLRLEVAQGKQLKEKNVHHITGKTSTGKQADDYAGHLFRVKVKKSKFTSANQQAEMFLISDPYKGLDWTENVYRSSVDVQDSKNQYGFISGGAWRKYTTDDGEDINLRDTEWVPFLESEEGFPVAQELMLKQLLVNFPEGYAPLDNHHFDVTIDPIYKALEEHYIEQEKQAKEDAKEAKKKEKEEKQAKKEKE